MKSSRSVNLIVILLAIAVGLLFVYFPQKKSVIDSNICSGTPTCGDLVIINKGMPFTSLSYIELEQETGTTGAQNNQSKRFYKLPSVALDFIVGVTSVIGIAIFIKKTTKKR